MPKISKQEKLNKEIVNEIGELKELIYILREHNKEVEKDIREARVLLFMAMGVLMALFGLILGFSIKFFL